MNTQVFTKLSTWTPVNYVGSSLSIGEKAANAFENYFFLGGRKVKVAEIKGNTVIASNPEWVNQSGLVTALKVASYMTIILPIIMLLGKAIFRSLHDIKIPGVYLEPTESKMKFFDPHAQAKDQKNQPNFKEKLKNGTWLKVKFNNNKNEKYIYSLEANGAVRVQHIEKELGKGGFGKVKLLHDLQSGSRSALKIADPVKDVNGEFLTNESEKIIQINAIAKSKFIQKPPLTSVITVQRSYCKKSDKPENRKAFETIAYDGSVEGLLKKKLPLSQKLDIVNQVVQGIRDLHINGIAHNDIKPDNILYLEKKNKFEIAIIDLSGAIFKNSQDRDLQYTLGYTNQGEAISALCAPSEVNFDARMLLDIRAVGITMFQILTDTVWNRDEPLNKKIQPGSLELLLGKVLKEPKYKELFALIKKMIAEKVNIKDAHLSGAPELIKKGFRFLNLNKVVDATIKTKRPLIEDVCEVVANAMAAE